MTNLIIALILSCLLVPEESFAQVTGDCVIPDVSFDAPLYGFEPHPDDSRGDIFTFNNTVNIIEITVQDVTPGSSDFFTAEYNAETKELTFKLTPAFEGFEAVTPNQPQTTYNLLIELVMQCQTNIQKMTFQLPITDTNNNDPIFSEQVYIYNLPMPFPALELTLMQAITATDIDFSQPPLTFSITTAGMEENFEIGNGAVVDDLKKTHAVVLKVKKYLHLIESLSFQIEATDKDGKAGTATVSIIVNETASLVTSPEFGKISYGGKYIVDDAALDTIQLIGGPVEIIADKPSEVSVESSDSEHFDVKNEDGIVSITLSNDFSEEMLETETYYQLTLTATVPGAEKEGETVITIELPKQEDCLAPTVDFTASSYRAMYIIGESGAQDSVELLDPIEIDSADPASIIFTTDNTDNFEVTNSEKSVSVTLIKNLDESTLQDALYILAITATLDGVPSSASSTVVVIELPQDECETTPIPTTVPTTPPTTTPTTAEPTTTVCPTPSDTTIEACTCPPTITPTECPTETTTVYIPTECPTETTTVYITTECPTDATHITTDCPELTVSTTTMTTDCPLECPSTTTVVTECPSTLPPGPVDTNVWFEYGRYPFQIPSRFTGSLGKVEAIVQVPEPITYTFTGEYPTQIDLNPETAEVTVQSEMLTGKYEFEIQVEGLQTGDKKQTTIWIYVDGFINCGDNSTEFAYSLLVKDIPEGIENSDIFVVNSEVSGIPEILSATPPVAIDWFSFNEGSLQSTAIDREHEAIAETSQIILELKYTDPELYAPHYVDFYNPRAWIDLAEDNIPNDGTLMKLVLNILDENDNDPKFESSRITVGYPEANLAGDLLPLYVAKVLATDADKDAVITYSTTSENFVVNSATGTVYPKRNSIVGGDDQTITVEASDGTRGDTIEITVKVLEIGNVAMIVAKDKIVEDIDAVLNQLNNGNTNFQLHLIAGAVIDDQSVGKSLLASVTRTKAAGDTTALKMVVYGLDTEDELVSSSDIENFINNLGDFTAESWESVTCNANGGGSSDEASDTPLIVVSVILGILIVLVIAAGAFFCYYKIRKGKKEAYKDLIEDDNNSSVGGFEKNQKAKSSVRSSSDMLAQRRPTGPGFIFEADYKPDDEATKVKTQDDDDVEEDEQSKKPRESINHFVKFENPNPSSHYSSIYANNSPEPEQRKSVTFNDDVQKIDILEEDDQDKDVRL